MPSTISKKKRKNVFVCVGSRPNLFQKIFGVVLDWSYVEHINKLHN